MSEILEERCFESSHSLMNFRNWATQVFHFDLMGYPPADILLPAGGSVLSFHAGFQIGKDGIRFVFVHLVDDRLRQFTQDCTGDGVIDFQ